MNKGLKIVVAGDWYADIYEKAMASAFSQLGNTVIPFRIASYFANAIGNARPDRQMGILEKIWYKVQYKYIAGPIINKLNRDLLQLIYTGKPDLIFIYRGNYFFPSTIQKIKENTSAKIFLYNNDDPFSHSHPGYLWRYFIKGLPYYHHVFVYRDKNIEDCKKIGISATSLLRSYYRKEENYPIQKITDRRYINPVCFIGHYEDDGRDEQLKYLLDNGIPLKIYGTLWNKSKHYHFFCAKMSEPIHALYADYNLCINSNQICLVFLSAKNHDTYTRRCFEIPAAGTFMLSQYTDDMDQLFTKGIEADYFSGKEALLEKINYYLQNVEKREQLAEAGYKRLIADGHEVSNRAEQILKTYYSIAK